MVDIEGVAEKMRVVYNGHFYSEGESSPAKGLFLYI
jgi:hypothetical protein